jgi:hypothetical protein
MVGLVCEASRLSLGHSCVLIPSFVRTEPFMQHVDIMMRIFIKAGVRDMGNFFAEFQEFTSSVEALQV